MRKKLFYIIITTALCFMAYFSGVEHTEAMVETVPEPITDTNTIPLDQCIPLEDIACYYTNDSGFTCIELKDIQYQLDDANNDAYMDILEDLEDVTMEFSDRYLDLDTVIRYCGTDTGLMIYTEDGSGYYLETELME